jgi:TfoX/Sxy family transcriptional regulator of competence genes
VYLDGKVVALVCDNTLFVKPTDGGRQFAGAVDEAPAYPGGKPWFMIGDGLEDTEWLAGLVRITANELPEPKPKRPKATKRCSSSAGRNP